MTEVPRLFNVKGVAELWKVSPHTVRKWVKEGKLRPIRLCRRLLFHPDECARFLAQGEETTSHVER
jgi:excisionase family DNA binding protein